jgi:hypothetical protein
MRQKRKVKITLHQKMNNNLNGEKLRSIPQVFIYVVLATQRKDQKFLQV